MICDAIIADCGKVVKITLSIVGRGLVPRQVPGVTANGRGLWAAAPFRADREIAGDRPPRYDSGQFLSVLP